MNPKLKALVAVATLSVLIALTATVWQNQQDAKTDKPANKPAAAKGVSADLVVMITDVGSKKQPTTSDLTGGLACSKSIPAICRGKITCTAKSNSDACTYLATHRKELFGELDRGGAPGQGRACSAIYGGPEVARVYGRVEGEDVIVRLTRVNSCEIEHWDKHAPLWTSSQD